MIVEPTGGRGSRPDAEFPVRRPALLARRRRRLRHLARWQRSGLRDEPRRRQATSTNWEIYTVRLTAARRRRFDQPRRRRRARTTRPTASTSPGACRCAPAMKATAGGWSFTIARAARSTCSPRTSIVTSTGFTWTPDSKRIAFTVDDRGREIAHLIPVTGGGARSILTQGTSDVDELQFTADGRTLVYSEKSGATPAEIFKASSGGGAPVALTHLNDELSPSRIARRWRSSPSRAPRARRCRASWSSRRASIRQEVPGAAADPRRTAGQPGAKAGATAGTPQVIAARGLRGGDAESARINRLRPEVHRRDQRRLGRQGLRRHHGRDRPRRRPAVRR